MAINLNILAKADPKLREGEQRSQKRDKEEYTFRDIKLDFAIGKLNDTNEQGIKNNSDIQNIDDIAAIEQSVKNILNTSPGEKLLNPYLGLNLKHFLFDPITKQTGDDIARAIYSGLAQQEPRINVTKVQVVGNVSEESYEITIAIEIPSLNNNRGFITGSLSSDGFKFKN